VRVRFLPVSLFAVPGRQREMLLAFLPRVCEIYLFDASPSWKERVRASRSGDQVVDVVELVYSDTTCLQMDEEQHLFDS